MQISIPSSARVMLVPAVISLIFLKSSSPQTGLWWIRKILPRLLRGSPSFSCSREVCL